MERLLSEKVTELRRFGAITCIGASLLFKERLEFL